MTSSESHPPKQLEPLSASKRKRPRGCLIFLGILGLFFFLGIVGVFLFAYTEGKRAERDWNEFKAHWEAKGEIFDLEKLIPPDVPDEENFAKAPIIAELFDSSTSKRLDNLSLSNFAEFKERPVPSDHEYSKRRDALGGFRLKLAEYFESDDEAISEHEAAKRILKAFAPHASTFEELETASTRPQAHYSIDYSDRIFDIPTFHLQRMNESKRTITLRARANLSSNHPQAVTKDIVTILRCARLTGEDPMLLSHLVEVTITKVGLQLLWQALETGQLTTADLILIRNTLEKTSLEQRYIDAIRFHRAHFLSNIDSYLKPDSIFLESEPELRNVIRCFRIFGMYDAFIYRNKLSYCDFIQSHYLGNNPNTQSPGFDIDAIAKVEGDLLALEKNTILPVNPYAMLAIESGHALKGIIAEGSAHTSVRIDLARVAIALELYRREHGGYPDKLAPLAPSYIDAVPVDLITGNPLHYRIKPDGTPVIYSVGLNKVDEGGLLKRDRDLGDWVWQYTLPDNFDEVDWRE